MMVSTKGRYALRVMLDLAMQEQEQYISLNDIAVRQRISMKYLEALSRCSIKPGFCKAGGEKTEGTGLQESHGSTRSARY